MFGPIEDTNSKKERYGLPPASAVITRGKSTASRTPPPQRTPTKKQRVNFRSPVDRSPLRIADKSYMSDARSLDSNLTMI